MNRLADMKLTRIDEIETLYPYKDMVWREPCRSAYGIIICETGKSIFTYNGGETICEPNSIVFIPKGANYVLYEVKGGVYYSLNFDCETQNNLSEFIHMDNEYPDKFLKCFFKLQEINALGNNKLGLMKHIYEYLEMIVTEYNRLQSPLMSVLTYIQENYSDCELTNSTLAEKSGYTEAYMRQLFKSQVGTTPKQYILDIRLQHASQMLAETTKKVTKITSDCGFSNLAHFSRVFRAKFGESPIEYRASHRGIWH